VYIFDFTKYDRKGIWGKNMKKVKRKEEEKKKKKRRKKRRKKREKKKKGEQFYKQHYFFPYQHRGHQFDHVSTGRGVQERRVEDSIKSPHFLSITLMSDCLYFFPITSVTEPNVYFPMMSSGEKILFCKKLSLQFSLYCADISL
jgi:hypothetical protein